ncbi:MAG: creatininase family protein [Pigmentiphaga sp.]|uniref:creatininase family protein n=1 Tax=Pigmentiphaga sp. TaxID=1977564 RepID=UPI003B57648F
MNASSTRTGKAPPLVGQYTRKEFREAVSGGRLKCVIVAVGATEQHADHLAMDHDIAMATHVAVEVAKRLTPAVVVAAPTILGLSEHHMIHAGTLTASPGAWFSVVFDTVASFARHGIRNVLVLNGHAGNEAPVDGILRQWQQYFRTSYPDFNLQFHSYWNLDRSGAEQLVGVAVPGHAHDYETSMALYALPENVDHQALAAVPGSLATLATKEKGARLTELAVEATAQYVVEMLAGEHRELRRGTTSGERYRQAQANSVPSPVSIQSS